MCVVAGWVCWCAGCVCNTTFVDKCDLTVVWQIWSADSKHAHTAVCSGCGVKRGTQAEADTEAEAEIHCVQVSWPWILSLPVGSLTHSLTGSQFTLGTDSAHTTHTQSSGLRPLSSTSATHNPSPQT